jgi:hypothetical protein
MGSRLRRPGAHCGSPTTRRSAPVYPPGKLFCLGPDFIKILRVNHSFVLPESFIHGVQGSRFGHHGQIGTASLRGNPWCPRYTQASPPTPGLQEARSILRNERLDVGSVSRRVGYESSSQFSREYSRLFGTPPVREISNARSA